MLRALESLRGLSADRLESVCADEAAAYETVRVRLSGLDACVGDEVVSCCMALFTLGCRNGSAVCGSVVTLEIAYELCVKWMESVSSEGGIDIAAGAALHGLVALVAQECAPKMPVEMRGQLEAAYSSTMQRTLTALLTEQRVRLVFAESMKAGILSHDDISLACGWGYAMICFFMKHPGTIPAAEQAGMFTAALALYRRVEPSPLSDEWWSGTCDVVDVTSARLGLLWTMLAAVKRLPSARQCSWWDELLDHAIRITKVNLSVGLSGRDTMAWVHVRQSLGVVEVAAQDALQHEMLIGAGMVDALEYGILHDFPYVSASVSAFAAGAAVALVGRNEGGKVLRREAVHAVLENVHTFFQPTTTWFQAHVKMVMAHVTRVSIMAISDANKKHMLDFEPLIDMLLDCLIIDDENHRKGQDGADALQEASAGVIHQLSLYGPGAAALRSHSAAVSTLHKLCDVGTKVSKERGAAALFELEEEKRQAKQSSSGLDDGAGTGLSSGQKPPPHVMASYNWDHQEVILRVVGSLQSRGYLVWVDTEQMKGATVDTMALAVEGSAVVLIGVSRAYKESSNCRMEAQYALQKKKPLVPLMLVEGYEADGWLGLLLGTSM
eukprot:COSAG06_NODE_9000_length_2014_cov_3.650835_2_plen_609_part_01